MDVLPKGAKVVQKVTPIRGVVESTRFNEEKQQLEYHVIHPGESGDAHARWFIGDELELDPEAAK